MANNFDLNRFRTEFLQSEGWQVSDCYKPYDDKFLRKDAQDAYEGAKWAWQHRQGEVDRLNQWYSNVKLQLENREIDSAADAKKINDLQSKLQEIRQIAIGVRHGNYSTESSKCAALNVAAQLERVLREVNL